MTILLIVYLVITGNCFVVFAYQLPASDIKPSRRLLSISMLATYKAFNSCLKTYNFNI